MKKDDNPLASAMNRAATAGTRLQGDAANSDGSTKGTRIPSSRQGKKGVLLHVDPEIAKRLKLLAVERDTTIVALGLEALDLLFERYGE